MERVKFVIDAFDLAWLWSKWGNILNKLFGLEMSTNAAK
jgi:hypothetical protein